MKSRIRQKSISSALPTFLLNGRVGSVLFICLAIVILAATVIRPNLIAGARVGAADVMAPILSAINQPFQNTAEAIGSVSGVASLRAENTQLKAENIRLREWYQTALMLQAENQSLQELLNLKVNPAHRYVTARVISDAGSAFVKTVLVSSGKEEGIQKNQAVLAGEGMIGRVIEVGNKAARVLLLTDINSRIPVLIEGSSQKAVLVGNNKDYPVLKYLPQDAGIIEGVRIVTSGHGGVFPPGLPIGRLTKNTQGDFFVKPYADMNRVSYVRVVDAPRNPSLIRGNLNPATR